MGLLTDEVGQWKRAFGLLAGIPKTLKNNPANRATLDSVLGVTGMIPGVGDVQAGLTAANDLKRGDYLSAALNGVGVLPMVPAMAGTFVGKGSKTWDALKNAEALNMEKAGVAPRDIWQRTGNWKAPDGMWRQEIPDNSVAQYRPVSSFDVPANKTFRIDEIDKAYPKLASTPVSGSYDLNTLPQGSFNGKNIRIHGSEQPSTAIHELQHAIQQQEGFARGGSPEGMRKLLSDDPLFQASYSDAELMDAYKRLAGEAEARATQSRMKLNEAQRRALFPEDSYDVPINSLIIRR